jgi:hypothetical protein
VITFRSSFRLRHDLARQGLWTTIYLRLVLGSSWTRRERIVLPRSKRFLRSWARSDFLRFSTIFYDFFKCFFRRSSRRRLRRIECHLLHLAGLSVQRVPSLAFCGIECAASALSCCLVGQQDTSVHTSYLIRHICARIKSVTLKTPVRSSYVIRGRTCKPRLTASASGSSVSIFIFLTSAISPPSALLRQKCTGHLE